jgi:fatty-acyl-CoA synthase
MRRDGAGFYYFVDRIGDTFRWKGENVSTTEVAATLCGCPGVTEALVYGVAVPGHDGRAGMAALLTRPEFRLDLLWQHAERTLPRYARPQFLRLIGGIDMTGTFKPMKSELARTAFDPALTADALYASDSGAGNYVALDDSLYRRICAGQWRL